MFYICQSPRDKTDPLGPLYVMKRIIRDTFVCFAAARQEARLEDALKKVKTCRRVNHFQIKQQQVIRDKTVLPLLLPLRRWIGSQELNTYIVFQNTRSTLLFVWWICLTNFPVAALPLCIVGLSAQSSHRGVDIKTDHYWKPNKRVKGLRYLTSAISGIYVKLSEG